MSRRTTALRLGPVLGRLVLVALSVAVALSAADAVVRFTDLDFRPMRNRANDDAVLERVEFRTRVVTNALGFRDPRLPGPKPARTTRIVALGDSFTQGYGVEEEEAYPRRLERLLDARGPGRRHEVINLGVPGACPLDYLAHLEEVGLAYEPDVVLVGVMANDVNDLRSLRTMGARILPQVLRQVQAEIQDVRPAWKRLPSRFWPSLYDYVGERLRLLLRDASAHAAEGEPPRRRAPSEGRWKDVLLRVAERYGRRAEVEARLAGAAPEQLAALRPVLTGEYRMDESEDDLPMLQLMAFVQPHVHAGMVLLPPSFDAAWAETTDLLRRIDRTARGAGARTVVAFVPAAFQVSAEAVAVRERVGFAAEPRLLTDTTMVDRLRAFGATAGIPVVDLLAPLRARAAEPLYYPVDGHWTPLGHQVAAEVLAAAIPAG
jgi:hypothetical protein